MSVENQDTGQDSFLDIVANLVGIMIILVVVVGIKANQEWTKPKDDKATVEIESLETEIAESSLAHAKWKTDQERLKQEIQKELSEVKQLAQLRHQMLMEAEQVAALIEEEKSKLDEREQKRIEGEVRLANLRAERDKAKDMLAAYTAESTTVSKTIDHYPTPIAKTVFSEEVHYRLQAGRLARVPLDELLTRMKMEWKFKAEKLTRVRSTVETVSEIDGFRMQYELAKIKEQRQTEYGELSRETIQFQGFKILPTRPQLGEDLADSLVEGSAFRRSLQGKTPAKTTVSIWVYPDSYEQFGQLKTWLHRNGYQSAAWPLAAGDLISGGPNGLRSTAQ